MFESPEPASSSSPDDEQRRRTRVEDSFTAATHLALDYPERVATATEHFRERAERTTGPGRPGAGPTSAVFRPF